MSVSRFPERASVNEDFVSNFSLLEKDEDCLSKWSLVTTILICYASLILLLNTVWGVCTSPKLCLVCGHKAQGTYAFCSYF